MSSQVTLVKDTKNSECAHSGPAQATQMTTPRIFFLLDYLAFLRPEAVLNAPLLPRVVSEITHTGFSGLIQLFDCVRKIGLIPAYFLASGFHSAC
jgi:hypothetical protein